MKWVVMYSGGKGSWGAARYLRDEQGVNPADVILLFTDTNGEDPDLYRFLVQSAADIFGVTVPLPPLTARGHLGNAADKVLLMTLARAYLPGLVWLDNDGATIWDTFRKARMIGNTRLSVCSRVLKQAPAREWLEANTDPADTRVVVGIDWTETHRLPAIERNYQPFKAVAPLTWPGAWSKDRIDTELAEAGIAQPSLYAKGFAHNNCAGACVRGGMGQWALLLEQNPERYAEEERQENAFRDEVGKDVSILRDRSLAVRLASVGLTEAETEWLKEPDSAGVDEDGNAWTDRGDRYLLHTETQTILDLPTVIPLTLTALRHRVEGTEPGEVDRDDIGGCGCTTDLMSLDELDDEVPA